jgi:5-hydroxyisourate hydrolase-like protein (transthyretin family)
MGQSFEGLKANEIEVTLQKLPLAKTSPSVVTKTTSFNKEANTATVTLPKSTDIGRYQVEFKIKDAIHIQVITVTDSLKVSQAQYKVASLRAFPTSFDGEATFPSPIKGIKDAMDNQFLHVAIKAGFSQSTEVLQQVYLSIKRKSS